MAKSGNPWSANADDNVSTDVRHLDIDPTERLIPEDLRKRSNCQ